MRYFICALGTLAITACVPGRPQIMERPAAIAPIACAPAPPPDPVAAAESPRVVSQEISGIRFEGIAFDSRNHRLVVVDQADGPGSRFPDAQSAARSVNGAAAVNAGFFTPENSPLGLVASSGKISGAWNSASSLGSGIWYETSAGETAIVRRESLGRGQAMAMRELIQAGPMLVENGRPVGGLEATKSSTRTLILWDGGTRWWIGCASSCTLAALTQAAATGQPAGWPVRHALNLDGGRSSDLWISGVIPGGPLLRRPPWNRPVRNFLVLTPAG